MRLQAVGAAQAVTACLLHNELRVAVAGKVKHQRCGAEAKASPQGVESAEADAKPSDLPLARLKVG